MSRARLCLIPVCAILTILPARGRTAPPSAIPAHADADSGSSIKPATVGGPIDSLVPLSAWEPRDPEANLSLVPHALITDPLGRLWILDRSRGRIARLNADGEGRSLAIGSLSVGGVSTPVADIAASGAFLFLLQPAIESISLLDLDGYYRNQVNLEPELERAGYRGFLASRLFVGLSGDLWLLEPRSGRLLRLDRLGRFLDAPLNAMAGADRLRRIEDATFGPDDALLLLDGGRSGIATISATGAPQAFEPLAGPLVEPASIACDAIGLRYVLEGNGRLRVVRPGGTVVWDGRLIGGGPDGPHRTCIIDGDVLCAADAAHGTIHRWRIARRGPEDAQH